MNTYYNKNGKLHREGAPARILKSGTKECTEYWVDGKLDRKGAPARIWNDGSEEWYSNDKLHREGDDPARILMSKILGVYKIKEWWVNGKLDRKGAPARFWNDKNGDFGTEYWVEGKLHREGDGHALYSHDKILGITTKEWRIEGKLHREGNNPARIYTIKDTTIKEWWVDGKRIRDPKLPSYCCIL